MKVLIIGTGLTGLMAAAGLTGLLSENTSHTGEQEKKRLQVELIGDGGGASPFVHGFNMPLHENDSVETFLEDTIAGGYGLSEPDLALSLCYGSLGLLKDLEKLGISLEKQAGSYSLLKPLGSSWPRVAGTGNHTGAQIMNRLRNLLMNQEGVRFTPDSRVLRLHVEDNRARGVILWNRHLKKLQYRSADCILMASGGFCGIYPFSTNTVDSAGDGIAMAYEAGIPLMDMEFVQFEPSVALYPESLKGKSVITTMFFEGAVLRNSKMERFLKKEDGSGPGECINKDILSKVIYEEIQKGNGTRHGGIYFDATGVGKKRLEEKYGSYVERYRQAGMDITREPFEIAPGPHTSLGGIVISPEGRTCVEGIWAAGEIAGGIHGANRIGGNAGLETLVFGKRAGENILRYLEEQEEQTCREIEYDEVAITVEKESIKGFSLKTLCDLRRDMEDILQKELSIIRNGTGLAAAAYRLDAMAEEVKGAGCGEYPFEKLRLENDLICASLLAHGAKERTESIGCHNRSDGETGDSQYHVIIKKGRKGMEVNRSGEGQGYRNEKDNC